MVFGDKTKILEKAIDEDELSLGQSKNLKNLFLLSFHDRDPLAAKISGFGWRVSSARRSEELRSRFLSSNALIAVIDLREAAEEGIGALRELANIISKNGIALLALVDQSEQFEIANKCYEAGATHFLDMSNINADIEQAIKFAFRFAEHIRGGDEGLRHFAALLAETDQQWSFNPQTLGSAKISNNLQRSWPEVDFEKYPATGIYRQLNDVERTRVRGAMGRIRDGSPQAAVPHIMNGKKVIHHLHVFDGMVHGRIEPIVDEELLEDWTERDLLSGLKNASAARSWIKDKLQDDQTLGILTLGLKNFQTINAAYGRTVGDQVLRIVGQRLLTETFNQPEDRCLVARVDGQNFLLASVLNISPDEFTEFAEKLMDDLFHPALVNQRPIQLVARGGITTDNRGAEEGLMIRQSSLALAEAIASDTVRIKVNSSSAQDLRLEQQLESQLEQAIENGEIAIALQPQIQMNTGQLAGAEALARWDHPEFGMLGASTLFSVAERAGMMGALSSHIHECALAVGASWPDSLAFLRLSINVTAGDLAKRKFATEFLLKVAKSEFPGDRLTLEITESEIIDDMDGSVGHLDTLRKENVRIAIDDFGTGYSSLSYLKDLPLDYLKIDSGLTADIGGSQKDQIVIRSIVDMANSLDLKVIAEGVETEVQLKALQELGCEFFQGFLRSGPLSPDEFEIFALRSD